MTNESNPKAYYQELFAKADAKIGQSLKIRLPLPEGGSSKLGGLLADLSRYKYNAAAETVTITMVEYTGLREAQLKAEDLEEKLLIAELRLELLSIRSGLTPPPKPSAGEVLSKALALASRLPDPYGK